MPLLSKRRNQKASVISNPLPSSGRVNDPNQVGLRNLYSLPTKFPTNPNYAPWAPVSPTKSQREILSRIAYEERERKRVELAWKHGLDAVSVKSGHLRARKRTQSEPTTPNGHQPKPIIDSINSQRSRSRTRAPVQSDEEGENAEPSELKWTSRSQEPLALMKLKTLGVTLSSPSAASTSPLTRITVFSLDLASSDATSDWIPLAALAISHLHLLTALRYVGPRHSHSPFPRALSDALTTSGAPLQSLGLSRISRIEGMKAFDEIIGNTLQEIKLNDCDTNVWSLLLLCMKHPKNIEGLSPPEGLDWLNASQWESLRSLRLGHGQPEVLADILTSIEECNSRNSADELPVEPELHSLVLSHFSALQLPLIIRLARTFGSPSVKKLELSCVALPTFGPRLLENLACYFDGVEDFRLHVASPHSPSNESKRIVRQRIPAVDWTQDGKFEMAAFAEALSHFHRLRTLEINHALLPHLLSLTRQFPSESTKGGPDLVADQMVAVVRIFSSANHRLRRCGFSYSLASHFLDCVIERRRGAEAKIVEHWSKAPSPSNGTVEP